MSRFASVLFVSTAAIAVFGCSAHTPAASPSTGQASAPTESSIKSPSSSATGTAASGTVPTAPPVSTTTPSASDDQLVREVHARFMDMFAVIGDPPNPDHPEIGVTTTGVAADRLRANLSERRADGRRTVGGYRSSIVSVNLTSDRATVADCSLDQGVGYRADGSIVAPADTTSFLRTTYLTRTAAGWRVAEFLKGDSCVPAS